MGIKQTLATAAALSVVAFSSVAEAQSSIRPRPTGHCMDNMLNTRILAEDLFNTPIDEWRDSFLSSIGPQNIRALTSWIGFFDRKITRDIEKVGSALTKSSDRETLNWEGLVKDTHFSLHGALAKVKEKNLSLKEWNDLGKQARADYVWAFHEKLSKVKYDPNPQLCPTIKR